MKNGSTGSASATTVLSTDQVTRYQDCIRKTVRWAHNNMDRVVSEPDLEGHYKAPYFWASVGDPVMAGRWRRLIRKRFLRDDGDFRTRDDFKGFGAIPCSPPNQYIYMNGWIIAGLHRLGSYDIVGSALDFILRFQDEKYGGFYYTFDIPTKTIDRRLMDSSSTSSAGLALLAAGRTSEACRAGDFLVRLLECQPQPDKYFFSCLRPNGELYTDVFGNEDQWDPNSRKQKCLSAEGTHELTWLIGKPTKFLARLYTATGNQKYLDAAKEAFEFFHKLDKGAWTNYSSCKTMWAGADLYRATGDRRYVDTTFRILDYFCDSQLASGCWVHYLWYKQESDQPLAVTMDITFEFGGEISDVLYDLAGAGLIA